MAARFDHLIVAARTLQEGVDWLHTRLEGIVPSVGGAHPRMGTHNRLVRLSGASFLEVIAIDPAAPSPGRPRWFGLDTAAMQARLARQPRLIGWVAAVADIEAAVAACPIDIGPPEPITRGALEWLITIPENGSLAEAGTMPALIEWPRDRSHPASGMQDLGCSLISLALGHPEPSRLDAALDAVAFDRRDVVVQGSPSDHSLTALIRTSTGTTILQS